MAFLDDMTHEQVARALDVPLGTAKTRIRSGLQLLRTQLAPLTASLLGVGLAIIGFRYAQTQVELDREHRALTQVTTSDLVPLRLTPVSALVPAGAHANYRGRAGSDLAVLTTELLPATPSGSTYQGWVRHGDQWTSLGTFTVAADGSAMLIAQDPALTTPPDTVEITFEQGGGAKTPSSNVFLQWSPL
jgi:hypothetical protein